jgi:hypothetical protein
MEAGLDPPLEGNPVLGRQPPGRGQPLQRHACGEPARGEIFAAMNPARRARRGPRVPCGHIVALLPCGQLHEVNDKENAPKVEARQTKNPGRRPRDTVQDRQYCVAPAFSNPGGLRYSGISHNMIAIRSNSQEHCMTRDRPLPPPILSCYIEAALFNEVHMRPTGRV